MGLIGNYSPLNRTPGRLLAGATGSNRSNSNTSGGMRNLFAGSANLPKIASIPNGYLGPVAWFLPQRAGGMASYSLISGIIASTGNLAGGKNAEGDLAAAISITSGDLALIVSGVAAILATGSITNANILSVTLATASLAASGTLSDAALGAIASNIAALVASGNFSASSLKGMGWIEAETGEGRALTPEGLAEAVWNALITDYGVSGSMAEELRKKLNLSDFIGLK